MPKPPPTRWRIGLRELGDGSACQKRCGSTDTDTAHDLGRQPNAKEVGGHADPTGIEVTEGGVRPITQLPPGSRAVAAAVGQTAKG